MASIPIGQAGVQGLRDSMDRAQAAASRIASTSVRGDVGELSEAIVDLQLAKQQAQASAKLVEAGNDTLGTLLDVLA